MKQRVITFGLLAAIATVAWGDISAQKYPERRMARDGNKAYRQGDFEAAETEYRRALETNPELKEALFNLGNAAFRQEKGEEAAKIYLGIAADSTANPSMLSAANYNLGNTMLAGQKIEDAIESYKQALRIDPTDMQAKYNLAYAKKLLQNQPPEDENQDDQNQDQDQDQDQDQNQDQDQDQNQDNQDQNNDQDQNDQDQDDQNGEGDDRQDQGEPPQSQEQEQEGGGIDRQDAEHMLDAMQDEEDKTREKVNAREVPAAARSGKNW